MYTFKEIDNNSTVLEHNAVNYTHDFSNSTPGVNYIKIVSGANATDFVQVKLGTLAALKMRIGEFAFLPLYAGIAVTAEAYGGACVVEYAQWSATS